MPSLSGLRPVRPLPLPLRPTAVDDARDIVAAVREELGRTTGLRRALAFDTTDTVVLGNGTVSLRDESLQLKLKPLPKDHSFLTLRAPLMLTGTFKHPQIHPDVARITLRAVAAAVLASIAPPAALIATYETGPGKDVSCRPGEKFADAQSKWLRSASN